MKNRLFALVSSIVFGVFATACAAGGDTIDGPAEEATENAPDTEVQAAGEASEVDAETGESAAALSSCSNALIDPGGCYTCSDLTNKAVSYCAARKKKYAGGACGSDASCKLAGYIKFTCC